MTYKVEKVGHKGEVVIGEELREKLQIGPGWFAYQFLVDDHIEIHFLPPEHNRSLKGNLAKHVKGDGIPADADWGKIRDEAWDQMVKEDHFKWK